MSKIWDPSLFSELKGPELLLMLALADVAEDDGTSIFPLLINLAAKVRLASVDHLVRMLQRLHADGWLLKMSTSGHGADRRLHAEINMGRLGKTLRPRSKSPAPAQETPAPAQETPAPAQGIPYRKPIPRKPIPENPHEAAQSSGSSGLPFQSEQFISAWKEWERHRKEIRKPLTPTSRASQLATLKEYGHDSAIESINESIRNGWTGFWEPKQRRGKDTGGGRVRGGDTAKYAAGAVQA